MAYTKIIVIQKRLDKALHYVQNKESDLQDSADEYEDDDTDCQEPSGDAAGRIRGHEEGPAVPGQTENAAEGTVNTIGKMRLNLRRIFYQTTKKIGGFCMEILDEIISEKTQATFSGRPNGWRSGKLPLPDATILGTVERWGAKDRRQALDSTQYMSKIIGGSIKKSIAPQQQSRPPVRRVAQ